MLDALYTVSLEELQKNSCSDGAWNADAAWKGVWTGNVSYSIVLSLVAADSQTAMADLMHKVKRERIVQDTGTGGSWPIFRIA